MGWRQGLLRILGRTASLRLRNAPLSAAAHRFGEDRFLSAEERSWSWAACAPSFPKGISTSCHRLQSATDGDVSPVPSPLSAIPAPADSGKAGMEREQPAKAKSAQAVMKNIKQSPKKVNLVAKLVRGMRTRDALMQLRVTVKRAAKTISSVIRSASANATNNYGMDRKRLVVAECFVGKGRYTKRVWPHGRGKSGIRQHPSCRVTVIVKELTNEQEAEVARIKTMHFRERRKYKSKLVPHRIIESTWDWHRKPERVTNTVTKSLKSVTFNA